MPAFIIITPRTQCNKPTTRWSCNITKIIRVKSRYQGHLIHRKPIVFKRVIDALLDNYQFGVLLVKWTPKQIESVKKHHIQSIKDIIVAKCV